jgi:hypothetical protein
LRALSIGSFSHAVALFVETTSSFFDGRFPSKAQHEEVHQCGETSCRSAVLVRTAGVNDGSSLDDLFREEPVPVCRSRWFASVLPQEVRNLFDLKSLRIAILQERANGVHGQYLSFEP